MLACVKGPRPFQNYFSAKIVFIRQIIAYKDDLRHERVNKAAKYVDWSKEIKEWSILFERKNDIKW